MSRVPHRTRAIGFTVLAVANGLMLLLVGGASSLVGLVLSLLAMVLNWRLVRTEPEQEPAKVTGLNEFGDLDRHALLLAMDDTYAEIDAITHPRHVNVGNDMQLDTMTGVLTRQVAGHYVSKHDDAAIKRRYLAEQQQRRWTKGDEANLRKSQRWAADDFYAALQHARRQGDGVAPFTTRDIEHLDAHQYQQLRAELLAYQRRVTS